jgi:hypothetical protein
LRALALLALLAAPLPAAAAVVGPPAVPQPSAPGDLVGFDVQNTGGRSLASRYVEFGQPFVAGAVRPGSYLRSYFGGVGYAAQLDPKTTWPDGSVRYAVVTARVPALPAGATLPAMLTSRGVPLATLDLPRALAGYHVTATFSGGVSKTIDVGASLAAALSAGTAAYWRSGPAAAEARVDVPVSGSLHLLADVTVYADGSYSTALTVANDHAMQPTGGTASYSLSVRDRGVERVASGPLTHYQYQQWVARWWQHPDAPVGGPLPVNVRHDVAYLVGKAGVFQNYDTTAGIDPAAIPAASYAPLGAAGIEKAMPTAGDRPDIGPTTLNNAACLLSQDATLCRYARAQADAAASVPWHYWDPTRRDYLSLDDYPTLFADPRGDPKLTQPIAEPTWYPDRAHMPDLSLVPYVLWGDRFDLDQIDAQATFSEFNTWNVVRHDGLGALLNDSDEVRAQAWGQRELSDAAWANPDGGTRKAYWQRLENNSLQYQLGTVSPAYDAAAGELSGYFHCGFCAAQVEAPWQLDYMASTLATEAIRGNAPAKRLLQWAGRFAVARWHHGWSAAAGYWIPIGDAGTDAPYTTWARYEAANGTSDQLPSDGGAWVPLGLMGLADHCDVLADQDACGLYASVEARGAPGTDAASFRGVFSKFHVVPQVAAAAAGSGLAGSRR